MTIKASEFWSAHPPPTFTQSLGDDVITAVVTDYGLQIYKGDSVNVSQINLPRQSILPLLDWLEKTFK